MSVACGLHQGHNRDWRSGKQEQKQEQQMKKPHDHMTPQERAERMSRIIVSIMTFLGALGLLALVYFPMRYLQ